MEISKSATILIDEETSDLNLLNYHSLQSLVCCVFPSYLP